MTPKVDSQRSSAAVSESGATSKGSPIQPMPIFRSLRSACRALAICTSKRQGSGVAMTSVRPR